MVYCRFGNTLAVRIDRGEEIMEQLKAACLSENVKLAAVSAIGAVDEFTVGVYHVENKQYDKNTFTGAFEIVSLLGNITTMDGEYYAHLHMLAADDAGRTYGGHLNSARVSVTCEMFLTLIDGEIDRYHDDMIGINLLKL